MNLSLCFAIFKIICCCASGESALISSLASLTPGNESLPLWLWCNHATRIHSSYTTHETDMHKFDFKNVLCREGCCLNLQMANTGENDEAQATACKQNEGKPTWCATGYWNTVVIRHTPRRACKETWAFAPMSLDKEHCFCRGHLLLLFNVLYRIRCAFIKAPLRANAVLETSWEVLWLCLLVGAWQLGLCHSALSSMKRFRSEAAVDVSVLRSVAIQQEPFKFYV